MINSEMLLSQAWDLVMKQVIEAVEESAHPFRYVTLATIDKANTLRPRTVVLRDFTRSPDSLFTIYTASRGKV
jgi:hypothetical protein